MALTYLNGVSRLIYPLDQRLWGGSLLGVELNAGTRQLAFGGQAWFKERTGSKDIVRVGFRAAGLNGSPGVSNLYVTLEQLSQTFGPTTSGGASTATVAAADALSSGWVRTDPLDVNKTVTFGQKLAVRFQWQVFNTGDGITIYGLGTSGAGRGFPWSALSTDSGATWQKQGLFPNIVLEFTDGTFGTLRGAIPFDTIGSENLVSGNNYGIQFRLPFAVAIDALCAWGTPDGDQPTETTHLVLYQNTTLVDDSAEIGEYEDTIFGGSRLLCYPLKEPIELLANTDYIVAIRPNNNAAATIGYLTLADAAHRICHGDLNIGKRSRASSADAWSALGTTIIPRLGVRIVASGLISRILQAAGGSYSLTGTAATLRRSRKLMAAGGSYALTGTAATLRVSSKRLDAAVGSYALTGTAAALKRGRRLAANSGSYGLSGKAATLRVARRIAASSGSYAVTGSAATLRRGFRLTAASGSYAVTGTAAGLRSTRTISGAAGSYALTGTAADLIKRAVRVIAADAGTYSINGTAANLEYGRLLAAASGSYSLTGTAANLEYGRELAAAAGSYALTGTAATLKIGKGMMALAGTYSITFPDGDVMLKYGRRLVANSGSYGLTGSAVTLRPSARLTAEAGSYAVTGTAAGLRAGRLLAAASGSYLLTGTAAALEHGYYLAAAGGNYVVTGTAASLKYGRLLSAAAGTYTLNGSAVMLEIGAVTCTLPSAVYVSSPWRGMLPYPAGGTDRGELNQNAYYYCAEFEITLEVAPGGYSLSGTAANLEYGRKLAAAVGGYNVTGAAASLLYGHRIAAAGGSYVLTGTAAGLRKGFALLVGNGNYTINGQMASLLTTRRITATAGEYTWTGTAAGLKVARRLSTTPGGPQPIGGTYTLSGSDAGLLTFEPGWAKTFNYVVDEIMEP